MSLRPPSSSLSPGWDYAAATQAPVLDEDAYANQGQQHSYLVASSQQSNKPSASPYALDPTLFGASDLLDEGTLAMVADLGGHNEYLVGDNSAQDDVQYHELAYAFTHASGTPSPALPALSPPSTAGTAYSSPASSSSSPYSGLISPAALPPPRVVSPHKSSSLLPPADIYAASPGAIPTFATSMQSSQQSGENVSWFSDMQDSYIQQQQGAQVSVAPPSTPPRFAATLPDASHSMAHSGTLSSKKPTPSYSITDSHCLLSAHLYRSPSTYSTTSSPAGSPYARAVTPTNLNYGSDAYLGRRGSTGQFVERSPKRSPRRQSQNRPPPLNLESPGRNTRRQSRLSIEVPPYSRPSSRASRASALYSEERGLSPAPSSLVDQGTSSEMEQLMGQLGTFLSPEEMARSEGGSPSELSYAEHGHGAYGSTLAPSSASSSRPGGPYHSISDPLYPTASIEISGVTLNEEDFALLDEDDGYARPYPASAPAWQTTFDRGPSPSPVNYTHHAPYPGNYTSAPSSAATYVPYSQSASYAPSVPSNLAPPPRFESLPQHHMSSPHQRPRSVPGGASRPPPVLSYPPPSPSSGRRRRSSVDNASVYAPSNSYQRPASPYDHPSHPHSSPRRVRAPTAPAAPLPPRSQPQIYTHAYTYDAANPHAQPIPVAYTRRNSSPPPPHPLQTVPRTPTKGAATPSVLASPRKTPSRSPTKAKGKGEAVPMFINYSASDSKKLLSGVAPSGSSKRRREEAEAEAAATAAAEASADGSAGDK